MTNTRALTLSLVLQLCALAGLVALLLAANTAHAAPADTCDPATTEQCFACEPAEAAEPAPLPHLYLPLVQHLPRMSAESTPARPIATPEPEVELPLGDAGKNN